jgi:predicted nucleotidyltransferase
MVGHCGWSALFASRTLVAVMRVFLLRPDDQHYQRELADATGSRLYLVQRELARLERAGLVVKGRRGNRVHYQANRRHPTFEDLKRAFLKTVALGDALRSALTPLADRVRLAFIYGSSARGEETAGSDIDLFLVGRVSSREAARVLGPVKRDLGREFNAAIYSPEEFHQKARSGHHFIAAVMEHPKVFLMGDERELAELAR